MTKYLWPSTCFAYSKNLEIKICGFSWWSPGMDSKAFTSGEGWKKTSWLQDVTIISLHIPFSLLWEAGTEEMILWISPSYFVPQTLLSFFDKSESPTSHTHQFSDFSALRSLELQLAEPMLTPQVFLGMHKQVWKLSIQAQHYCKPLLEPSLAWINGTAKSTWQDGDCNLDTNQFMDQHAWK